MRKIDVIIEGMEKAIDVAKKVGTGDFASSYREEMKRKIIETIKNEISIIKWTLASATEEIEEPDENPIETPIEEPIESEETTIEEKETEEKGVYEE